MHHQHKCVAVEFLSELKSNKTEEQEAGPEARKLHPENLNRQINDLLLKTGMPKAS